MQKEYIVLFNGITDAIASLEKLIRELKALQRYSEEIYAKGDGNEKLNLSKREERILCDAVTVIKHLDRNTTETIIKIQSLVNHIKADNLTDTEGSVLLFIVEQYLLTDPPFWLRIPLHGCRRKLKNAQETHGD